MSFETQLQMRKENEEIVDYLKGLSNWEKEMKENEENHSKIEIQSSDSKTKDNATSRKEMVEVILNSFLSYEILITKGEIIIRCGRIR